MASEGSYNMRRQVRVSVKSHFSLHFDVSKGLKGFVGDATKIDFIEPKKESAKELSQQEPRNM